MSVCTFFGHSECYGLDAAVLRSAIEELIEQGITEFVVGNTKRRKRVSMNTAMKIFMVLLGVSTVGV